MARRRSRIDGLKVPFVVTMTVAAAGCGGTVSSGQGGPTDPNTSTGGSAGAAGAGAGGEIIRNPPRPFDPCPATLPGSGVACYVSPNDDCTYVQGPCAGTSHAKCQGEQWVITTDFSVPTCNPPAPPSPVETVCPPTMPAGGCNYQGPPCTYGPMCGGFPTQQATCVNNVWMMSMSSCNPPAPMTTVCPTVAPTSGTYCNYVGQPCEYQACNDPDPCACLEPPFTATCSNYQWMGQTTICDPGPPEDPDAGSPTPGDAGSWP